MSVVLKGVTPSSSSIYYDTNQTYKFSMNYCKNINLTERSNRYTCTITADDQIPAKLNVVLNVKNDNGGKKTAKDFNYTLTGNNNPPSKTFVGAGGKGTNIH